MKKNLPNFVKSAFLTIIVLLSINANAQMNFSLTPSSNTVCGGTPGNPVTVPLGCVLTNTVSGATYYTYTLSSTNAITGITWTGSVGVIGSTTNINALIGTTGVFTITGLAYASVSSSVILSSVTNTIMALAGPTISVAGPSTVCPNSVNTYTASGASTYTWFGSTGSGTYNINGGAVASMTAGSLATFSVRGTASNGCSNVNVFSPSLGSTSVSISNNTICPGSTATLNASGATSYTWSTGSNAAGIVVSPTVSTIYTLTSANSGCTITSTHLIVLSSFPIISVSGNTNMCTGSIVNLNAVGANTYTWVPGNLTGNAINVSPNVSTCYTVTGANSANCVASTVICLSVIPAPTVSVVSSGSVCAGSSITFTASGATTYTWSNMITVGPTLNIIPSTSAIYSVAAQHTSNACITIATVAAIVSPSCALVWPGDANRDGSVSNLDVLELGLAASATGAARSATSISWSAQYASAWSGTVSTGWNKVHADCNGDGIVNSNDQAAITANFASTHSFKTNNTAANPDISLVSQQNPVIGGMWNKADIMLGDASNNMNNIYGLVFDINYDQSKIQPDSVKIIYTGSFLNTNNQNIEFSKANYNNGKLYCASVRVDHGNVNGNGKIGEFWFKVKQGLPNNSTLVYSASNAQKINSNAVLGILTNDAGTTVNITNNVTGLKHMEFSNNVTLFPNPSNQTVSFTSQNAGLVKYSIQDMLGRKLLSGEFITTFTLDVSTLASGNYVVAFESKEVISNQKLIIQH